MWSNYAPSTCKFPIEYVCQKLWKIIESWQNYYHKHRVQFFWPTLYISHVRQKHKHFNALSSLYRNYALFKPDKKSRLNVKHTCTLQYTWCESLIKLFIYLCSYAEGMAIQHKQQFWKCRNLDNIDNDRLLCTNRNTIGTVSYIGDCRILNTPFNSKLLH